MLVNEVATEEVRQAAEAEIALQAVEVERARQAAEVERARQIAAEAERARQAAVEAERARQAAEDEEFIGYYPGEENRDPEYNLDIALPAPSRRVNVSNNRGNNRHHPYSRKSSNRNSATTLNHMR